MGKDTAALQASRRVAAVFSLTIVASLLPGLADAAGFSFPPWSELESIPSPAGPDSGQPHLAMSPDGTVVLSWLEPAGGGHALRYSRLDGETWSEPAEIARGEDWFVNWADFPSVVPVTDDVWAAHWLAKSADAAYAYDVMLSVSDDAGGTWSAPFSPHTDGTPTEHGFVTLFPWQDAIGVVWLDGRNMTGGHGDNSDHGAGGMTLRSALVSPDGELLEGRLVDELVCDCCQTDAVVTEDGPLVVYRNRTENEIRDIQAVSAAGRGWSEPVAVHDDGWEIAGCPVNGPAVSGDGRQIDVAWYTAADEPAVRFARSHDGGRTYAEPLHVDLAPRPAWGRVDVVTLEDGSSVVSYVDHTAPGRGHVMLREITAAGELSQDASFLSGDEPARQVGFPQMVRDGGELIVAWTAAEGEGSHRVHTVRVTRR